MGTCRVTVNQFSTIRWYNKEGLLHRENGPAITYGVNNKNWYINGLLHREDGPAVEWTDGSKEWYLNGTRLYEGEFLERVKTLARK